MNNKQLSALKRIVYRALSERVLSFSFHLKGFLFFTPCCRCLFFLSPIFFISCLLSLFLSRIPPSPCLFLPPGTALVCCFHAAAAIITVTTIVIVIVAVVVTVINTDLDICQCVMFTVFLYWVT